MRQFLHLFIVDRAVSSALTTAAHQHRLLPMVAAPATSRIDSFVHRWLQQYGIEGLPVGQWLGRISDREVVANWLVPVLATERAATAACSGLQWTTFASLQAADWPLDYQRWAIARLLSASGVPSVPGPFGHLDWLEEVSEWLEGVVGETARKRLDVNPHRLESHEVVLECRTAEGRWFFKGLSADRVGEATLTSVMSQLMPDSFARSVACEMRTDGSAWWLMTACPGTPLTERLTTDDVARGAQACARAQQTVAFEMLHGRYLPAPDMNLSALAIWSQQMVEGGGAECHQWSRAIEEACLEVAAAGPRSWVAADLDPSNVIVDGHDVRFIDLDDVVIGPAPLALSTFLRRLGGSALSSGWDPAWKIQVIHAYQRAWAPSLDVLQHWRSIDLVSECLECWLAWQRVVAKTDRGEVYGAREVVRPAIQRRLLRALQRD